MTRPNNNEKVYNRYVRSSYERLLLLQPQFNFKGLWQVGNRFYIYYPDLTDRSITKEGEHLVKWFDSACKTVTSPVQIVNSLPKEAQKIKERSSKELVDLASEPLTERNFIVSLHLSIPGSFPDFTVNFHHNPPKIIISTRRVLEKDEKSAMKKALSQMDENYWDLEFSVKENIKYPKFRFKELQDDIDIMTSRHLRNVNSEFKKLFEKDEDLWRQNKSGLFLWGEGEETLWPQSMNKNNSRCYLDTAINPAQNIRLLLSMYREVVVNVPLGKEKVESFFSQLKLSKEELFWLSNEERLFFIIPQSPDRYNIKFLCELAVNAPKSLIFTRQLSALMMKDYYQKFPLIAPHLNTSDKVSMLKLLQNESKRSDISDSLVDYLGNTWSILYRGIEQLGAMAFLEVGVGNLAGDIHKRVKGKDFQLEYSLAGLNVHTASALNATLIPQSVNFYNPSFICSSILSGVHTDMSRLIDSTIMSTIISSVLSIDNDANIRDFTNAFSGYDIDNVEKIVSNLSSKSNNVEELQAQIKSFNSKVIKYEKDISRLQNVDIVAGGILLSVLLGKEVAIASLVHWTVKNFLTNFNPRGFSSNFVDYIKSINSFVPKGVVSISRIKKQLKDIPHP